MMFPTGPLGKLFGYAALVIALLSGAAYALHEHDNRVLAEQTAAEQTARIATLTADHARVVSALELAASDAEAHAAASTTIRKKIANAPASSACVNSAPVRAYLDSLRKPTTGH